MDIVPWTQDPLSSNEETKHPTHVVILDPG